MLNARYHFITLVVVIVGIIVTMGAWAVQGKVCGTTDIRSTTDAFAKLEKCRIIEGDLHIVLIDVGNWEDQGSFPNLVEVTGELLFFRVYGLKSLGLLFPNLAVIGGEQLFEGYALIVYEMFDLEDIGLAGLTLIRNGAVRIEKNPKLCHLDTVDWGRITQSVPPSENFFSKNNNCANTCPSDCDMTDGVRRCWSAFSCQKMLTCPASCYTGVCNGDICCHPNCIGGCSGPSADQCTSCAGVIQTGDGGGETCAQQCSPGFYMYHNRRCLTADECLNFSDYELDHDNCDDQFNDRPCTKLFTEEDDTAAIPVCTVGCPRGYKTNPNDSSRCVHCQDGHCLKVCNSKVIDSITAAQHLQDCEMIQGTLHIKLKACIHEETLEKYLSQLVEVTGHIAVSYSPALHSLQFFKSLRKVGGEILVNDKYAIHIFNNPNLQELIPEQFPNFIDVNKGTALFQYNGKLRYEKISNFISRTNLNIEEAEVSNATNGNTLSSPMPQMHLEVLKLSTRFAFFKWPGISLADTQLLLGYFIFWKKAPVKSVKVYAGADACTEKGWHSTDIDCIYKPHECNKEDIVHFITQLEPWTQYAAFVRARTATTEGAVSNVVYFTTAASAPSIPLNLRVRATEPGKLHLTWDPPLKPNGNITHYRIKWKHIKDNVEEYQQRNYCLNQDSDVTNEARKCCPCPQKPQQQTVDEMLAERKANLDMMFQDMLQNEVYVKRMTMKRERRSTGNSDADSAGNSNFADVYDKEAFIVENLGNYEQFGFEVQACHSEIQDGDMMCSGNAVEWGRTLPDNKSDVIDESTISIEDVKQGIQIRLTDPPQPNGVILTYEIEITHGPESAMRSILMCFPYNGSGSNSYTISGLTPDDYNLRIRATSLAGAGPWTQYLPYTLLPEHFTYECYQWTDEDSYVMGYPSTPVAEKARCEVDLGYVFTEGDTDDYPGCEQCWCCKPVHSTGSSQP